MYSVEEGPVKVKEGEGQGRRQRGVASAFILEGDHMLLLLTNVTAISNE